MKFRSKVVEIEAFCFTSGTNLNPAVPQWFVDAVLAGNVVAAPDHIMIKTLEGEMRANVGDWIIRGTEGELYPCKPSVFERKYEEARSAHDEQPF